MRVFLASFAALILLALAGGGLLYFLVHGKLSDGSVIAKQIESRISGLVGEQHGVVLGETSLDLSRIGRIVLAGRDISIIRHSDGEKVFSLGQLEVHGGLLGIITGNVSFDKLYITGAELDMAQFGPAAALPLPAEFKTPVRETGNALARLQDTFASGGFREIEISDSKIAGPFLGRVAGDALHLRSLRLVPGPENGFTMTGNLDSQYSRVAIDGSYQRERIAGTKGSLDLSASGVSLREWLSDPLGEEGMLASDAAITVGAKITFAEDGTPTDPIVSLITTPGDLRIGRNSVGRINQAEFHLRLMLDKNQIELDRSDITIGGFRAVLVGGLLPEDPAQGYHGPVRYDLIIRRSVANPTRTGEARVPAAFKVAGVLDHQSNHLVMDRILMTTQKGVIEGSGSMLFTDSSPAIRATATTEGISVAALKQFWPSFIVSGARNWVHNHVLDGWINSGSFHAEIPAGVLLKIGRGATLEEDQYRVDLNVSRLGFRPFGELPPIKEGSGSVSIRGVALEGVLESGVVETDEIAPVTASKGRFFMADFSKYERWGEASIELDGDIGSIARISNRKPLLVMDRLKVEPEQFAGAGHADVAARFPIGRKIKYSEIDWNILLEMRNGSSSREIIGRKLSKANLLIDANPAGALVTGDMQIDGITSRVNLVEPIGKSGKVRRNRDITAVLDDKLRKKIGIDIAPVVTGPVSVRILDDGKGERYTLDFVDAELALPWVGWSKGKGIPASSQFLLKRKGKAFELNNFTLEGQGFRGAGKITLDKKGLRSAEIDQMQLNDFDDIRVRLERKDDTFNINASGLTYDARGVLNALFHQGGFTKAQGQRSVNLVANFETVIGFENRAVRNAVLLYESRFGRLHRLDLRSEGGGSQRYNVQAQLNGNDTLFSIKTNDAGGALAFTNIYTRMRGGSMDATLLQSETGPYRGPVRITNFAVVNEPRLKRMASNVKRQLQVDRGEQVRVLNEGGEPEVRFVVAEAEIERGKGYLHVGESVVRSPSIGLTMKGTVYNENDRMNLTGTFIPAIGLNMAVSAIPLIGQLFSDGKSPSVLGVAYRLSGPRTNPNLVINPVTELAPSAIDRVFEQQ